MDLVAGSPITMPDFDLHVETTPRVVKAGQPTKFSFTVHHPLTGAQAKDFALMHDKLFHLFVVSRDMQEFAHVHPQHHPDGSFTIEHTLPQARALRAVFRFPGDGRRRAGRDDADRDRRRRHRHHVRSRRS